jgi:hypothetical protein
MFQVSAHVKFYGERFLDPRPTPNFQEQVSVFINPGDRVVPALGISAAPLFIMTKTVNP